MKFWILVFVLHVADLSGAQAFFWNRYPPRPIYQQGGQYIQPNQFVQSGQYIQPGQPSFNYQPAGVNIQQLGAQAAYNPALQQSNIQGVPIGNQFGNQQVVQQPAFQQQTIPYGIQPNGFPIRAQQATQIGIAPGPITFPT